MRTDAQSYFTTYRVYNVFRTTNRHIASRTLIYTRCCQGLDTRTALDAASSAPSLTATLATVEFLQKLLPASVAHVHQPSCSAGATWGAACRRRPVLKACSQGCAQPRSGYLRSAMDYHLDGRGSRPQHGGYAPLPLPQPGAAMCTAADGGGTSAAGSDCGGQVGGGALSRPESRVATELPDPGLSPGRQGRYLDSSKERTPGRVESKGEGQALGLGCGGQGLGLGCGGSPHRQVEPRQEYVTGDDDTVLPAANPFLRFIGTPPSAGKLRGLGATAAPARSPLGTRHEVQQQQQPSTAPQYRISHQQQNQQQQQRQAQPGVFPLAVVRDAETAPAHCQAEFNQQQQPASAYCASAAASAAVGAYPLPQPGCGHLHEGRSAPSGPLAHPGANPAAPQPRPDSSMPRAAGPARPDGPTSSAPPHAAQPDRPSRQHPGLAPVQEDTTQQLRQAGGSGPQADPQRHDSRHTTTQPGRSAVLGTKAWTGAPQSSRGPAFAEPAVSAAPSQPRPAPRPAWPPRAAGERAVELPAAAGGNGVFHSGQTAPWGQSQRHGGQQLDWRDGRQLHQQATQTQSSAGPLGVPPQPGVQGASQALGPYPAAVWGGGHLAQQQQMNRTQQQHQINGPSEQPLMAPKGPVRAAGPCAARHAVAGTAGAVSSVSWDAPSQCPGANGAGPCRQEPAGGQHPRAPSSLPMADTRMWPAPLPRPQEQQQGQHQQQQQRLDHQHPRHHHDYPQQHRQQGDQQQQNAPQQPWQAWHPLGGYPPQGQPPSHHAGLGQGQGAESQRVTGPEQSHPSGRHLSYTAAQHNANQYMQHQQPWQLQQQWPARPHVQQQGPPLQPSLQQPQQAQQQAQQRAAGQPPQPQTMRHTMPETRNATRPAMTFPGEYRGRCPYDRCVLCQCRGCGTFRVDRNRDMPPLPWDGAYFDNTRMQLFPSVPM